MRPITRILRILIVILLFIPVFAHLQDLTASKIALFSLSVFFIFEVFFRFSISRKMPSQTLSTPIKDIFQVTTLSASIVLLAPTAKEMLVRLFYYSPIQFFLNKANIMQNELLDIEIPKTTLIEKSIEVAKKAKGKYVTTIDILMAYLLLTETSSHVLFNKKLQEKDIEYLGYWTRNHFPYEEQEIKNRVSFWGEGIGQDFVSGWTLETKKYTNNFTVSLLNQTKHTVSREKEYTALLDMLSKKENNNVILIGDVGAGKESLVEALAIDSFAGALGQQLSYKRVFELLLGALLAGVGSKGELQARLEAILQEVSHAGDIILYIPEFQNVLGSSLDISDTLLPYLRSGKMPIIGTMTAANYKTYMEKNSLKEMFEEITVGEPNQADAMQMLLEKALEIEEKYKVSITYLAIVQAVNIAGKYLVDTVLPGNAVILLEDVASVISHRKPARVLPEDVTEKVEAKSHIRVGTPSKDETNILLNLEKILHTKVIGQESAISSVAEAFRRLRSGMASSTKPLSFLFLGPTGVGKTETAKALALSYFGNENAMVRFDMSEYSDATGIMKLLGAPGSMQRGELTEKVHDNPFSLVLLDEFEKASSDVLNLFLQVLEDGRLTDSFGKTVSFANTIIIATSNAASEVIREAVAGGVKINQAFQSQLLEYLEQRAIFKPELLNRFDAIVAFTSLTNTEVIQVVQLLLEETKQKLQKQDIALSFDMQVVKKIASEGYDVTLGARPLRRFIQDKIEDMLAKKILDGTIARGASVKISIDNSGNISVSS